MYRNIRYAFFQPAENDMITLLHFHLHHPIMIGNKKTKDVQFYAEVRQSLGSSPGGVGGCQCAHRSCCRAGREGWRADEQGLTACRGGAGCEGCGLSVGPNLHQPRFGPTLNP